MASGGNLSSDQHPASPVKTVAKPCLKLSPREIEVLNWTAYGKTCFEIAILLALSEETVRTYIKTACRKLNASNKTHAAALGLSYGLISILHNIPASPSAMNTVKPAAMPEADTLPAL